jgi:hypothetical protein
MFITVHGTIGLIIGTYSQNPILAFFLGLISHYCCDIIPHGDTKVPKKYNNLIYWGLAGIIDLSILSITLLALLLFNKINIYNQNISAAFLGSVLPDFLLLGYFLSNKKIFKIPFKIHYFFHNLISKKYEWPFWIGLGLQITLFIVSIIIYLHIC